MVGHMQQQRCSGADTGIPLIGVAQALQRDLGQDTDAANGTLVSLQRALRVRHAGSAAQSAASRGHERPGTNSSGWLKAQVRRVPL